MTNLVGSLHRNLVASRRCRLLSRAVNDLIPVEAASLVDVGCGDGVIMQLIQQQRPAMEITGLEVVIRPERQGNILPFDGQSLPLESNSVDVAMFVDVLHHTIDPLVLLAEAKRVARRAIVIKDHCRDGWLAGPTLRFMDWVGNAHHGVALPYNYWPEHRWRAAFESLQLRIDHWENRLRLYPWPASWIFDRKLHFACRLLVD